MNFTSRETSRADEAFHFRGHRLEMLYKTAHSLLADERIADAAKAFRFMLKVAPRDERGWLGLGECHERAAQLYVALELYGAGSVVAAPPGSASVRCLLARARTLAKLGRDLHAALDAAESSAAHQGDEELIALVDAERERLS